jgi:hypothetical protein
MICGHAFFVSLTAVTLLTACHGPAPLAQPDQAARASSTPHPEAKLPAVAPGAVAISDGDEYSVTIPPAARPCIVFPASMFDPAACPPEARPVESFPALERARVLAVGSVRIDDSGILRVARLTSSLNKLRRSFEPDLEVAEAFAAGMADEITAAVPGTTVRGGRPAVRLLRVGGVTVVRISYDIDGATGPNEFLQHNVSYTVWAPDGSYSFVLSSASANGAVFDGLAEAMAATIRLAHPALPRPPEPDEARRAAIEEARRLGAVDPDAGAGILAPEIIQGVVRRNFGRFRLCYEDGLGRDSRLQGQISVKFIIDRSGAVSMTADGGSTMPDQGVVDCVVHRFRDLKFPPPQGGIVTVVYPIQFNPGP